MLEKRKREREKKRDRQTFLNLSHSSLVGSSSSSRRTHDVSPQGTTTVVRDNSEHHNPPTLIAKDDKDTNSTEIYSSSTFMKFYRRSCKSLCNKKPQSLAVPEPENPLAASKEVPKKSNSQEAVTTDKIITSSKSTRAARRQQAKREHDKKIQQEKRIRMMLNTDLSEEDELLYNSFHR